MEHLSLPSKSFSSIQKWEESKPEAASCSSSPRATCDPPWQQQSWLRALLWLWLNHNQARPAHLLPGRSCTAQHQTHKQIFLVDIIWRKIPTCSWLLQGLLPGKGLAGGLSFAGRHKKQRTRACQTAVELERMKCSCMGRKYAFCI